MADRPVPVRPPRARASARSRGRRATLCIAAVTTVALGLSVRTFSDGAWTGPAGDALYAVLIYLLVAILIPRKPTALVAGTAMTACLLIEVLQLTGLPAELAQSWPPVGLVLGTTFGTADLLAYAGACALAYAIDRTLSNGHRQQGRVLGPSNCDDHPVPSTFTIVTCSHHSPEDLFDLSLNIGAHVASMANSEERAVAGVTTGQIGPDETVTWRARHFWIWFKMTARIIEYDRPRRFVDRQVAGPFRSFVHEHDFLVDDDDGSTVMVDTFTLASPFFGRLAERAVLVPYLRRLITRRNSHLLEALDSAVPDDEPK